MAVTSGDVTRAAILGLVKAGVRPEKANELLEAVDEREGRVLVLAPLKGEPRAGDRIRVVDGVGPQAMVVVAAARAEARVDGWAIVGDPVDPSTADDVEILRGRA